MQPRPVNRVIHTEEAQIASGVGDWCHYKESYFPAVCVTDLQRNIILSNNPAPKDKDVPIWTVNSARVMVTRFWSASTAYVTAVIHAPDAGQFIPAPPKELYYEHEFQVWMGWLDSPRFVKASDLCTGGDGGRGNRGRLLPVFTGSVDTFAVHSTSEGGYTFSIQARDRMKWFMDTSVTFNPSAEASGNVRPNGRTASQGDIARGDIISGVFRLGIGDTTEMTDACGLICNAGLDIGVKHDLGADGPEGLPNANVFYEKGELSGSTGCVGTVKSRPLLNYYVTRDYIIDQSSNVSNPIFDRKVPLEIVKQMAIQEAYVTEVFQDHRTGDIYYTPRANDLSALPNSYGGGRDGGGGDPKRFFRTYFFKVYPQDYYPDHNQMLTAFKEEQSSLGMMTNFIVNKHNNTGNNNTQLWSATLYVRPHGLPDNAPCRQHIADDTTINTPEEAAVVAAQLARIFGRETRAAMAILRGDPSFVPGEIIQVLGSPVADVSSEEQLIELMNADRSTITQWNAAYNAQLPSNYIRTNEGSQNATTPAPLPIQDGGNFNVQVEAERQRSYASILCQMNEAAVEMEREPPTIWRVEGIMHKYSFSEGYTTELALASPF